MIYISCPRFIYLDVIYISWARFIYLAPDLYILGHIYISWVRFIYLGPYLYILDQIYISCAGFIYLLVDLYCARFIKPLPLTRIFRYKLGCKVCFLICKYSCKGEGLHDECALDIAQNTIFHTANLFMTKLTTCNARTRPSDIESSTRESAMDL